MMKTIRQKSLRLVATLAVGASVFQIGGCGGISAASSYFSNIFNPCGSVLACDPAAYRFLTSGYEGPGFAPEIDPVCVFPPYCNPDPFVGGLAGGP